MTSLINDYSLIEYKLRQYFYLGQKHSMYVPHFLRTSSCDQKYQSDVNGIKIIGKIVKKNKLESINTIIPIILKIKKEDKLYDDQHLIFALAVCAGFNLKQCEKMVADAILTVCSDGLKLLMFVKFYKTAISLLFKEGYIPNDHKGFSHVFRTAVKDWYLKRDPFLTAQQIVRHKHYDGLSHNQVMKQIHISSSNPSQLIFILHTLYGMDKVEQHFGTKLRDVCLKDDNETYVIKQEYSIYMYYKSVDNLRNMDEKTLQEEIDFNNLGNIFEVLPKNMLSSIKILTALIRNMPLESLLDNTLHFARHKVFNLLLNENGIWEYIARFSSLSDLQKSRIHPIESFVEYVKYSRKYLDVLKFLNIASKKLIDSQIKLPEEKLVLISGTNSKERDSNPVTIEKTLITSEKTEYSVPLTVKNKNKKNHCAASNPGKKKKKISTSSATKSGLASDLLEKKSGRSDIAQDQPNNLKVLLKPLPKLDDEIQKFLSEGLVKKTLELIKPSGRKIIITYDSRMYLTTKKCFCTSLLKVHEAITLIILSLIYPDKTSNKPTILSLVEPGKQSINEVTIDYEQPLTFNSLSSILFKALPSEKKDVPDIIPESTMNWASKNKIECDVFVFLGSNKMNLKNIKVIKKEYEKFYKKPVKIIICCLNGMHSQQSNLNRQNMLFITGFDKNVGKLIDSFIKNEF